MIDKEETNQTLFFGRPNPNQSKTLRSSEFLNSKDSNNRAGWKRGPKSNQFQRYQYSNVSNKRACTLIYFSEKFHLARFDFFNFTGEYFETFV